MTRWNAPTLLAVIWLLGCAAEHGRYLSISLQRAPEDERSEQEKALEDCFANVVREIGMEILDCHSQEVGIKSLCAVYPAAETGFALYLDFYGDDISVSIRQPYERADFSVATRAFRFLQSELDAHGFVNAKAHKIRYWTYDVHLNGNEP